MLFPYPLLLCDIGGTNVRFALAQAPDEPLTLLGASRTAAHPGLAQAASAALAGVPAPRSMIVCAAGPAQGRSLALTNADWTIDGPATAQALGLEQGLTLNDFEAVAFALPTLGPGQARRIGPAPPAGRETRPGGPRLALGPGTGLGVAALAEIDGRYVAIASEAGHVDFAPANAAEAELWAHVSRPHGRITAETLISGPGLERLHAAACARDGLPALAMDAAQITQEGLAGPGPARDSLMLLWRLTARFAGDMALAFLARGGVTLAGGVLPRIASLLDEQAFRAAFEDKEPMAAILRDVETRLIVADHVALDGMAAIGAAPHRYAIDYAARAWR